MLANIQRNVLRPGDSILFARLEVCARLWLFPFPHNLGLTRLVFPNTLGYLKYGQLRFPNRWWRAAGDESEV